MGRSIASALLVGAPFLVPACAPGEVTVEEPGDTSDLPEGVAGCWEAGTLLDVRGAAGAGAGYAAPRLAGSCTETTFVVQSNGMPTYTFVQTTPNALVEQDDTWEVPRSPVRAASPTTIPLLGPVGFAVNGAVFYGPNEAAVPAAEAWGDPVYNGLMDPCLGHTASAYHFHALAQKCLVQEAVSSATPWTLPDVDTTKPSPVLGWAGDGFPIYGPQGCVDEACTEVVTYRSGYVQVADPVRDAWDAYVWEASDDAAVLDACNGHVGPEGDYHYHATEGFPYIVGCFAGTPSASFSGGAGGGGDMGGGDMGGGGPQTCVVEEDCEGACPADALDCTCHDSPMGRICVPTCVTDEDCPVGAGPALTCDEAQGVCVPAGRP